MRGIRALVVALVIVAVLAVGGVIAVFLFHNDHWITIRFPLLQLDWSHPFAVSEWESPLYALMLVCTLLGMVLITIVYLPLWASRSFTLNRDRRFIHNLEDELTDLRNLPVTDPAPLEDIEDEPAGKRRGSKPLSEDDEEALLIAALQQPTPKREPGR